ncbi:MAG: tail fiber domain-containing protein [Alphaproteobacteria bacterium]|nr:tail fiber domain-containing protein [Alphaproteobacteria bacterium]
MLRFDRSTTMKSRRGFSLVELAIVVGVTGLLFGGLWRLMASGNSQLREQTAADQMNQLVSATRSFLAGQQGQALINTLAANATLQLALPAAAASAAGTGGCGVALTALQGGQAIDTFCNFLPTGFWVGAGGTANSFGQSYQIFVRRDNTTAPALAQNYDFLIITTGGDVIPDSSGGRIAANLGSNGGFLFSNNNCGAPAATTACGAFGSFNLSLAAGGPYGAIAAAASGHIVTQNSSTLSAAANTQWLARVAIAGDTAVPPLFNTMNVPLNMRTGGAALLNMFGNQLNLGDGVALGGGGTINMQQGVLQGPGRINIINTNGDVPLTVNNTTTGVAATPAAQITKGENCDIFTTPGTCQPALAVTGNVQISRSINVIANGSFVGTLQAGTFIYSSDIRAKKNIVPLTSALDKVAQLNGYSFLWRKDDRQDIGLIAQEVQKVYPELVHTTQGDRLGVQYGNLIAPMIEAIKELRQQNIALKAKLDAQEKTLEDLSAR